MPDDTVSVPSARDIKGLRREYEKLARECDKAIAVKNQPEVNRLMMAKREAHTAWHAAVVSERHAKRDAAKANGLTPGVK